MSAERETNAAERVLTFLAAHDLADNVVAFDCSTETAELAAEAMGCELGQIAKSLVFVADGQPVLALVAGDRRGDAKAIAAALDARKVRFADAETVRRATGYEVGGVSPFDLPADLTVLVDDSLARYETVYPAAGTSSSMVRMTLGQLLDITSGRVCRISR